MTIFLLKRPSLDHDESETVFAAFATRAGAEAALATIADLWRQTAINIGPYPNEGDLASRTRWWKAC